MISKGLMEELRKRTRDALKFSKQEEEKGFDLHRKSIVFDSLSPRDPTILTTVTEAEIDKMLDAGKTFPEIQGRIFGHPSVQRDLIRDTEAREKYAGVWNLSGVTAINRSLPNDSLQSAISGISYETHKLESLRDIVVKAICAEDVRRAKRDGKHAIMWNLQNTLPFGGGVDVECELGNIDLLYRLGIRAVQLTYNLRNFVGDGCTERYQSGLSYFGLRVVERLNELGILVDVSHCGHKTTMDAIEASNDPVAATHVGCKAVHHHNRNKTDEEIKAIAEKGGYVGILREQPFIGGRGTIKEVLDHIDHAVDLVGSDHVGIGSDREHYPYHPRFLETMERALEQGTSRRFWAGWRPGEPAASLEKSLEMDTSETTQGSMSWISWPYYTVGLVSRGYSDSEIRKIIGGSFLRVLEKVVG